MNLISRCAGRRICNVILIGSILALAGCIGGGGPDLSYENPDWRDSVADSITFPLSEPIELRVGVMRNATSYMNSVGVKWIEEATNIILKFEGIASSPGDVALGSIVRAGNLYDIIVDGKLFLGEESTRMLFVDFREFPELLPNVRELAESDERYRNGLAAKMTMDGELYSLGAFDPNPTPYQGSLVYRRDLFEKHDLGFDTWEELGRSLRKLKTLYPDSAPFGGTANDLFYNLPAYFGTGVSKDHVIYYDTVRADWVFGPYEPEFETFLRFFSELYAEGILLPEMFASVTNETRKLYASDTVFVSPYAGGSGLTFSFMGDEYGGLNDDGDWDGVGKWVDSMPIPTHGDGETGTSSVDLYSYVGGGWNVYNQSEHVAEAIVLLDFLFDPVNALSADLGAPGTIWEMTDSGPALLEEYAVLYASGATNAVRERATELGITTGSSLSGMRYTTPTGFFGAPTLDNYRYLVKNVTGKYLPGISIPLNPGLIISTDADFDYDRASNVVGLDSFMQGQVSQFIIGKRSLDELDDFRAECKKQGADKLLELYRANSKVFTGAIF